jgi:hypothetical protein
MTTEIPAADTNVVTIDLNALPQFPPLSNPNFSDGVWDAASVFADVVNVSQFEPAFDSIFHAAQITAGHLNAVYPLIAASAASIIQEWIESGAFELYVDDLSAESVALASLDLEALLTSLSACAAAAAIFVGIAEQTGQVVSLTSPMNVEFPLIVRG